VSEDSWSETDTELYRAIASVAVPRRVEQLATIAVLTPNDAARPCSIVELGCGEGALAYALLRCFANASYVGLDGSRGMLERAERTLQTFEGRVRLEHFDLSANNWRTCLRGADVVVSSLCIHHLGGSAKRSLFADVCSALAEQGAFLIADLVAPQRPEATELFASTWDLDAEHQSGATDLYKRFVGAEWNLYRFPDPVDRPSGLFEQLTWMRDVGFEIVDCFWMRAGHAIYGGYKSRRAPGAVLAFGNALAAAKEALAGMR
jgi:tRNA (cmo5U34)-methyltransferase